MTSSLNASIPIAGADAEETMGRSNRVSCFDVSLMPAESIRKREVESFSIHYSIATSKWIATIARPSNNPINQEEKKKCVSFPFTSEREARKFAKVYSPPKMMTGATKCVCCSVPFEGKCKSHHCRNCGAQVCDRCSTRWSVRMVPKTYLSNHNAPLTVRACQSCDWLSNAFCMALLQGNYDDAVRFHSSGNVNLRCTFADIHKEAMFPIHCAVMGGNLELVKWLVDVQGCPISVRRDPRSGTLLSVQTSSSRTLIDLAMAGKKPKVEILSYLVRKNLSVTDAKDPTLAPKTLQALMVSGFRCEKDEADFDLESVRNVESSDGSVATLEDACIICCEKHMDCCLTPCGHQVCCSECGVKLTKCPICKQSCSVLRIYRM